MRLLWASIGYLSYPKNNTCHGVTPSSSLNLVIG
jgi:hypothetical protein